MLRKIKKIHFIGIGGIGMSGIAQVLLKLGYEVSGSDIQKTELTLELEKMGAKIVYTHRAQNVEKKDVVVYSSSISSDNCEIISAEKLKIPIIQRAEMLAELMRIKYSIAIAGAHGKTTTTSMISEILREAKFDPTVIIGGRLRYLGLNANLGTGEYLVAEADESDGSFLHLSPTIAVVMNIDREHLSFYNNIRNIKKTFVDFLNKVPFYGVSVICLDEKNIRSIIPKLKRNFITFGVYTKAEITASNIKFDKQFTKFEVFEKNVLLGKIDLCVPGLYNVYNALAAIATARELEIDYKTIYYALYHFKGVERRFQIKYEQNGITVVDDYGHHPTEIEATLTAIKENWNKRIICVFQPHRYTRTKELLEDFATSFFQVDVLIVTEIYAASETSIPGINGKLVADIISKYGHKNVIFIPTKDEIIEYLYKIVISGDIVITLGAGDVYKIGEAYIRKKTAKIEQ